MARAASRTKPRCSARIIQGDDHILVVDKPAGVSIAHERSDDFDLLSKLRQDAACGDSLRLVHRLDKDTSGVLLLAKNLEAQRHLSLQFEHRQVRKLYLAIVSGCPADQEGSIDRPIAPDRRGRNRVQINADKGKAAVTRWRRLARFRSASLLVCKPLTGRTHQIRVHLQAAGFPLLVDPIYGRGEAFCLSSIKTDYRRKQGEQERPLLSRCSLHAVSLTFRHPATDGIMNTEAAPAKDFRLALDKLFQYDSVGEGIDLDSANWRGEADHPIDSA
jgi:RluA family pseudouridine synthase